MSGTHRRMPDRDKPFTVQRARISYRPRRHAARVRRPQLFRIVSRDCGAVHVSKSDDSIVCAGGGDRRPPAPVVQNANWNPARAPTLLLLKPYVTPAETCDISPTAAEIAVASAARFLK